MKRNRNMTESMIYACEILYVLCISASRSLSLDSNLLKYNYRLELFEKQL